MKKKKNILIIISLIIIIILIIRINFTITKKQSNQSSNSKNEEKQQTNNLKYNENEEMLKEKNIDGIIFKNIKCTFDGSISIIEYTIINQTTETIQLDEYEIIVKDDKNNILTILSPTLNLELQPNETYDTGNAVNIDLTKAASMEIVIVK